MCHSSLYHAGRYMLWGKAEAKETLRDLGGTLSEPLQVACFCQRQASTAGIPNTAPVLEYRPAKGAFACYFPVHRQDQRLHTPEAGGVHHGPELG